MVHARRAPVSLAPVLLAPVSLAPRIPIYLPTVAPVGGLSTRWKGESAAWRTRGSGMRLTLQASSHLRAYACFLDWFSLPAMKMRRSSQELVGDIDDDGTHDAVGPDRMLFVPEEDVDQECPESAVTPKSGKL